MDQAPNHSSADKSAGTPPSTGVSPHLSAWETYYKEASRRRRAAGSGRNLRVEKRRRRLRERIGIGISALLVSAMTMVFYLVLR